MKKFINKECFLTLILGIVFSSIISVKAVTALYDSKNVIYEKNDGTNIKVNEALDELYSNSTSSGGITFSYTGGGYIHKELNANGSVVINNNNYKKIKVLSGSSKITFSKNDGTTSVVNLSANSSTDIPSDTVSITCQSASRAAGDDGWGGEWLYGTANISIE